MFEKVSIHSRSENRLRRKLFDRAKFVFTNIHQKFTEAAKRWNELKDKKGQQPVQMQQA